MIVVGSGVLDMDLAKEARCRQTRAHCVRGTRCEPLAGACKQALELDCLREEGVRIAARTRSPSQDFDGADHGWTARGIYPIGGLELGQKIDGIADRKDIVTTSAAGEHRDHPDFRKSGKPQQRWGHIEAVACP